MTIYETSKEFACRNTERTFYGVHVQVVGAASIKDTVEILKMLTFDERLNYQVIYIKFKFLVEHVMEESHHCT